MLLFVAGQNDSIPKNRIIFEGNNVRTFDVRVIEDNIQIDNNSKTDISYLLKAKEKPLALSYNFNLNKYLNPNKEEASNMLLEQKPMDDDIMVVKHFKGKNTTDDGLKTTQDLGSLESNTKYVRIEYRDFATVDGDRVKVYLNEKVIDRNVMLDGLYYTIHIKLEDKGYNRIDIEAINEGQFGPNTAEFVVYDDKGRVIAHKSWNLATKEVATLGIIKSQ